MIGQEFANRIEKISEEKKTRVICALDLVRNKSESKDVFLKRILKHVSLIQDSVAALKIGYPLVLSIGIEIASEIKRKASDVPLIADFKIADIGNTNKLITQVTYNAGFDAVIAHAFVGFDSLKAVVDVASAEGDKAVFVLVNMSHPGSLQFITPKWIDLTNITLKVDATGVIAPGTRPKEIAEIRKMLGNERLILSPGIGAQGGGPGQAILNGADYEIIGRAIYNAEDPKSAARKLAQITWEKYKIKRGD